MDKEQIENEAISYVEDILGTGNICEAETKKSFIAGASWRINSVWHDTMEIPKQSEWFIAQIGEDCFDTFVMEVERERWSRWIKGMNIKCWAYIKDLLPDVS